MVESSPSRKLKVYGFTYKALGTSFGLDIPAYSLAEAKMRVASISETASYDGEVWANIPAGPTPVPGFLVRAGCWLANRIPRLPRGSRVDK